MTVSIFLSWSGPRSRAIAKALFDWIPLLLPEAKPWMSDENIEKGEQWNRQIMEEAGYRMGIACLTPEAINEPAILFESGMLCVNHSDKSVRLWTVLMGIEKDKVLWPLGQFQHTYLDRNDFFRLIESINNKCDNPREPEHLNKVFNMHWSELDEKIQHAAGLDHEEVNADISTDDRMDELIRMVKTLISRPGNNPREDFGVFDPPRRQLGKINSPYSGVHTSGDTGEMLKKTWEKLQGEIARQIIELRMESQKREGTTDETKGP